MLPLYYILLKLFIKATSDDGHSDCGDYDDEGWETDQQIWETVRIEQKKKDSTTSQVKVFQLPTAFD